MSTEKKNLAHRIFLILFFCLLFLHTPAYAVWLLFTFDNDGGSGDGDWNNPLNWQEDALPDNADEVLMTASIISNSGSPAHVAWFSATGIGQLGIALTVDGGVTFSNNTSIANWVFLNGDATFNDTSYNDGSIIGLATFNNSALNYGILDGAVVFNGSNINYGKIIWNVIFRDSSYNDANATITGNADFYNTSYNMGSISGNARFHMYTVSSNQVNIIDDANFLGTGTVLGSVLDASDVIIASWNLTGTSKLNAGFLKGDATLWNSSQNFGIISGNVVFNDIADNSGGIVQGNATFNETSYNGGIVMGNGHFYDLSQNQWSIRGDATYMAYTAAAGRVEISANANFYGTGNVDGSIYDSLGLSVWLWSLRNGSILNGTLKGDATFYDTSLNNGLILGNGAFFNTSANNGTISKDGTFNDTTTNTWNIQGNAYFVPTATNTGTGVIGWSIHIITPAPIGGGGGGGGSSIPQTTTSFVSASSPPEPIPESIQSVPEADIVTIDSFIEDPFISLDTQDTVEVQKPNEPIVSDVTHALIPAPIRAPHKKTNNPSSISSLVIVAAEQDPELSIGIQYSAVCELLYNMDTLYAILDKRICDTFSATHPLLDVVSYDTMRDTDDDMIITESSWKDYFPFVAWIFFLFFGTAWFWFGSKKVG